jgi:nicotinate-nucleotide adenylyltransferase
VDTLQDLSREFPSDELFLMVGADVARDLCHWQDADKLGELARIVAMSRAGASAAPALPGITRTITVPSIDVSATTVREAVRNRAPVTGMVPDSVADYIRTHRLYHSGK